MKDVHALHHDDLLFVTFNDKGQSYGDLQPVLANFVDTIARNGALLPLSFLDWRQMPKNRLEDAWKLVIARFCISEKNKRFVMQMMGVAWRRWRTQVKSTSYDLNTPLQELVSIRPVPHGLYSEVWEILCQHWKVNENLLDEVVQRRLQDMSEGTQPIKVHADAFRPEHSGRCLGAGATPSQVFPNQCKRSSFYSQSCHSTADTTENLRAMEEKMKTKMKVQESQWRAEMEEQKAQLEREMEQMRRTQEQFQNFTRVMQNMIHGTVGRSRGPEMMPEQMTMIMANIM
ncbi:uncharacterized protein [Henckelia pumila]|uniref:uncharacterized protein isoform X2 n=1 Tax=Henckelia pumila TaxID=405737 RepID=UPI003C6E82AB